MEYNLTGLGDDLFGNLAYDIVRSVLGIDPLPIDRSVRWSGGSLHPITLETLSFRGRVAWPAGPTQQIWEGTTHFNTIFVEQAPDPARNSDLTSDVIHQDLRSWRTSESYTERGDQINNIMYICNAPLEPSFNVRAEAILGEYRDLGIKQYRIWDYGQIAQILDEQEAIRREYAALSLPIMFWQILVAMSRHRPLALAK